MRPPEQVPALCRLEGLEGTEVIHHVVGDGKDLSGTLVEGHVLLVQRVEALDGQGAVVAELDALPEGLALAWVGFPDGDDVGLLLVGLLDLLREVPTALDGRRRSGGLDCGGGREWGGGEDGLDARSPGNGRRPHEAPE